MEQNQNKKFRRNQNGSLRRKLNLLGQNQNENFTRKQKYEFSNETKKTFWKEIQTENLEGNQNIKVGRILK